MRLRKCPKCGKMFSAGGEKALCPECAVASKSSVMRMRICRACGNEFLGGPRAWYCPSCRAERKKETDRKHKRNGAARKLGSTDICTVCGKEYIVTGGLQRYCNDCAAEAVRKIDNAASRKWKAEHPDAIRATKQSKQNVCVICGKPVPRGTVSITCSPECAALRRRRGQQEADYKSGKRNRPPDISRLDDSLKERKKD